MSHLFSIPRAAPLRENSTNEILGAQSRVLCIEADVSSQPIAVGDNEDISSGSDPWTGFAVWI